MRSRRIWAGLAALLVAPLLLVVPSQPAGAATTYSSQIIADAPNIYWRLGETAGATSAVDSSGNGVTGVVAGSPTFGVTGAIAGDANTAVAINGAKVSDPGAYSSSNTMTEEVWFQTTTPTGGVLTSFTNGSGIVDRAIWIDNTGHLVFGVYPGSTKQITSSGTYNNGLWHMAAATLSSAGMILYVDGRQVAIDATTTTGQGSTASWNAGLAPAALSGFPDAPSTLGLTGNLDEVAFWSTTALTAQQILTEYSVGEGGLAQSTVSLTVDPAFMFGVANGASACNGETNYVSGAGTATAVTLGHLAAGANVSGGQALTVAGNAGGGFVVYARGTAASGNFKNGSHTFVDVAGSYASPAALGAGERFGFTYKDSTAASSVSNPGSNLFAALTSANNAVMGSATSTTGTGCVSFDAQASAATPAGSYAGTVIYNAIPTF